MEDKCELAAVAKTNSGFCWWGCQSTWLSYMEKWQSMWYTPNTVSFVQRTMINYRIYSILEYWYAMFRRAKKRELITLWAIWIKIHCSFPKHRAASHQCLQPIIHKKTLVSIYFAHMKWLEMPIFHGTRRTRLGFSIHFPRSITSSPVSGSGRAAASTRSPGSRKRHLGEKMGKAMQPWLLTNGDLHMRCE